MGSQERICGLCLKICDNYKAIEGNMWNIINTVLARIDLTALQQLVICTHCLEILTKCFDFKTTCLCTYGYVVPFVNEVKVKLDLKDVYLSKNINGTSILEDHNMCLFCMGPVKNYLAISVNTEEGDVKLRTMIKQCLPELDLSIIEKPVICAPCHGSLQNYFYFVTDCSSVQEKIKKYCETLDINSVGQRELSGFLQFTMRHEVDGNSENVIKAEKQSCDDSGDSMEKIDHKNTNKFDVIKLEEAFYEENESEVNVGNPFEYRTFLVKEETETKTNEQDFNSTNCCETLHLNRKGRVGQLTMRDVSTNEVDDNLINVIKVENQLSNDSETAIDKIDHKNESFMDKNDPNFGNEREISLKNLLESNKFETIKVEEKFRGKSESEVNNRVFVGIEDQKCLVKEEIEIKTNKLDFSSTNYRESPDFNSIDRLELGSLLQYAMGKGNGTSEAHGNSINVIKVEKQICNDSETAIEKIDCKNKSFMDTNAQKFDNEEISLKNLLESNKFEMVKIEETFCGENSNRFGDNVLQQQEFSTRLCTKRRCSFPSLEGDLLCINHTTNKNAKKVTMYKCDLCSFQTIHKRHLKVHELVHKDPSEVTMYKCECCSFQTKHKTQLKRHLLVHKDPSEISMYKCDFCSFQTRHKRHLKVHVLVHREPSEVTMYKCDSCSFQTKYKGSLKSHLLVHNSSLEVITYHCESCSYQTARKSHLNRHLLVHKRPSEVTMHKCDSCLFETKYKSYLKDHLLKHENHSQVTPKQNKHVAQWTVNGGRQ